MKLFMKLTSLGAVIGMGWLTLNATRSALLSCQNPATFAAIVYANTMSLLWGAIMVLTFWLHVRLDQISPQIPLNEK
jgi:hypothetical protein